MLASRNFFLSDPATAVGDQGREQGAARAGQKTRHEGGDDLNSGRCSRRIVAEFCDSGRERTSGCVVDFVLCGDDVADARGPED